MPDDLCTAPRIISLSPISLATDVTEVSLEASDLWLGTRTKAGGIATLTESFFGRSPWLHGQRVYHHLSLIENYGFHTYIDRRALFLLYFLFHYLKY